jgi:hypothetical protein
MAKLEYFEYMTSPLALYPDWIIEQYDLKRHALNGKVHLELRRAVWGLPQAGILANEQLQQKLDPFGYHECVNTPGLWYHATHPILFTLVVNDFGFKYKNNDNVKHLIASLKMMYTLTEYWTGDLYCGIALNWDYINIIVDISIPGYIKKKIQEYGHLVPSWRPKCPYLPEPKSLVLTHKPPSHPMVRQNWTQTGLNASTKLWEAYCAMHEQ